MAKILVVMADGVEETECMAVPDVLVRAGHSVCMAAVDSLQMTGSRGLPLAASVLLETVSADDFDLVYLPGGIAQAERCRDDARVQHLLARQIARSDAYLAIICAAPIALLPQSLASGRRLTSHPSVRDQLVAQAHWTGQRIERDGNLLTSQGPGTAIEFGLYLAALLGDQQQAAQITDAMLAYLPSAAN